jgi:hypothetical protein
LLALKFRYGSHAYHHDVMKDYPNSTPIIYGDYYFTEAIFRLKGSKELFW